MIDEPREHEAGALRWSIRSSFRVYVAALSDGAETVAEGATLSQDGRFEFTPDTAPVNAPNTLCFRGSVEFRGHGGLLAVKVRDPWIQIAPDGSGSVSVSSARSTDRRVTIATFTQSTTTGPTLSIDAPRLTSAGVSLLGDVYEPGDLLDSIDVSAGKTIQPRLPGDDFT